MDLLYNDNFYQHLSWFVRSSNVFVFPDPEPPAINILYGWSGISGQFGLCYFVSSFVM